MKLKDIPNMREFTSLSFDSKFEFRDSRHVLDIWTLNYIMDDCMQNKSPVNLNHYCNNNYLVSSLSDNQKRKFIFLGKDRFTNKNILYFLKLGSKYICRLYIIDEKHFKQNIW